MWRCWWPVVMPLWPSLLLIVTLVIDPNPVQGYCEQVVLPANTSTRALIPKHPGPHVHIFGPSMGTSYHPPQQVTAGQVIVKPKSTLSFEFTCVAGMPVNWRYIGPAVSSPDISFERGRNAAATCFHMTIVFPSAVNEITGQYVCYQEPAPEIQSNFTLYAGNAGTGFMIFYKAGLNYKDSMETGPILQLPCVANDPNTNITLWDKVHNDDDDWQQVSPRYYTFDPLTGVRVNQSEIAPIALYKCQSTLSKQDAVYFTYIAPNDTLVRPNAELLTLPVNKTSVQLECYGMVPVRFTKLEGLVPRLEYSANSNATTTGGKYGYKYGATVSINFGDSPIARFDISCYAAARPSDEITDGTDDSTGAPDESKGTRLLHSWKIQFSRDYFVPGLVFDPITTTATCFSQAPDQLNFHYVFCELITQCQFLQPCLQDSQAWACPTILAKNPKQLASNETSVTVQLQEFSGALSCIGVDVNETIYVHRTATTGRLNLDENQNDLVAINLIGNWEVMLGNLTQVECIASKRFFVNNLTFQLWAGDTMVKMLTQDYLSDEDNSLIAGMYIHRIQFKMMDLNVDRIVCVAPRYDGNATVSQAVRIKVKKKTGSHAGGGASSGTNWTAIVLGITATLFLIVVIVLMYFWKTTRAKVKAAATMNPGLMLSDMEFELLQRFREGSPHHLPKGGTGTDGVDVDGAGYAKEDPALDRDRAGDEYLNIVEDGHYYAQMIPYNTNQHEIDLNKLQFDLDAKGHRTILGIGEYGIVYKGVYDNGTFGIPVAVKELKPNAQYVYLKALLAEIKIMIYVGQHENVVEFRGACTRSKLEACIVLRLYPYGTLEKYLRDHRQTLAYQNVPAIRSITNAGSGYVNPTELCVNDLIRWSLQISSALEYLFFKKVIHGDLATRNVLLDETLTAKVSDFGLARQRYTDYDFPKLCDMPLPWRWMSIESLRHLEFTQQSDLWSFGVTIWEIFSLAEIPYIGQRLSSSFLNDLENGIRLERPANASEELYVLMRECWITNPKDRITIHQAKRRLAAIEAAAAGGPSQSINYKQIEFIGAD